MASVFAVSGVRAGATPAPSTAPRPPGRGVPPRPRVLDVTHPPGGPWAKGAGGARRREWPPRRSIRTSTSETTARSSGGSPPWEWATAWSRRPRSRGRCRPARAPQGVHRSAAAKYGKRPGEVAARRADRNLPRRVHPGRPHRQPARRVREERAQTPISSGASSPSSGPFVKAGQRSARARTCFRLSTSTSSRPCRTPAHVLGRGCLRDGGARVGRPLDAMFATITPSPIAAASLSGLPRDAHRQREGGGAEGSGRTSRRVWS